MNPSEDRDENLEVDAVASRIFNFLLNEADLQGVRYEITKYEDQPKKIKEINRSLAVFFLEALKAARKEERGKALEEAAVIAENHYDLEYDLANKIRQAKEKS